MATYKKRGFKNKASSNNAEALENKSTTANVIIQKLTELFANKGKPVKNVSDNGPQFVSAEFENFCKN